MSEIGDLENEFDKFTHNITEFKYKLYKIQLIYLYTRDNEQILIFSIIFFLISHYFHFLYLFSFIYYA